VAGRGRPKIPMGRGAACAWIATRDPWLVERVEACEAAGQPVRVDYWSDDEGGRYHVDDLPTRLTAAADTLDRSGVQEIAPGTYSRTEITGKWRRPEGAPPRAEDSICIERMFWFLMTNEPRSRQQLALDNAALWSDPRTGGGPDDRRFRRLLPKCLHHAQHRVAEMNRVAHAGRNGEEIDATSAAWERLDAWFRSLKMI